MRRMLQATLAIIITVTVFIISYAVVVYPLEYVTDCLQDTYTDVADDMGWDDGEEISNTIGMGPYFFAGATIIGIILTIIWYFAYAHKKEYEQY